MTEKKVNGRRKTICKYCGANWFLDGSTSNAQKHLKSKHLVGVWETDQKKGDVFKS